MSECRSCGAEIEWGVTAKGRRIPLDLAENSIDVPLNLRELGTLPDGSVSVEVAREHDGGRIPTRVSHFATCPNAKKHRRRK